MHEVELLPPFSFLDSYETTSEHQNAVGDQGESARYRRNDR